MLARLRTDFTLKPCILMWTDNSNFIGDNKKNIIKTQLGTYLEFFYRNFVLFFDLQYLH